MHQSVATSVTHDESEVKSHELLPDHHCLRPRLNHLDDRIRSTSLRSLLNELIDDAFLTYGRVAADDDFQYDWTSSGIIVRFETFFFLPFQLEELVGRLFDGSLISFRFFAFIQQHVMLSQFGVVPAYSNIILVLVPFFNTVPCVGYKFVNSLLVLLILICFVLADLMELS